MLWAYERCNCGQQVAERQPPCLYTQGVISHIGLRKHTNLMVNEDSDHSSRASRILLPSSPLCLHCVQARRAHALFSWWYDVRKFIFYIVLTRKWKKWHHKKNMSHFTVWTHQCQCIWSPVESQWSCTESGHTEKHATMQHYSTGQFIILYPNKQYSFWVCGFNLYSTLAWFVDSNSASSCVAMN